MAVEENSVCDDDDLRTEHLNVNRLQPDKLKELHENFVTFVFAGQEDNSAKFLCSSRPGRNCQNITS